MKCFLGNNYFYGLNLERLSFLEVIGKDLRIFFDDVCIDIFFILIFFLLFKIFILFYVKNLYGFVKNLVVIILLVELR